MLAVFIGSRLAGSALIAQTSVSRGASASAQPVTSSRIAISATSALSRFFFMGLSPYVLKELIPLYRRFPGLSTGVFSIFRLYSKSRSVRNRTTFCTFLRRPAFGYAWSFTGACSAGLLRPQFVRACALAGSVWPEHRLRYGLRAGFGSRIQHLRSSCRGAARMGAVAFLGGARARRVGA